jgi:hypothetical protein
VSEVRTLPTFQTKEEAWEWLDTTVNDPCVDNYRFYFEGDAEAEAKYEEQIREGCCGFFDKQIMISNQLAWIGCNYGH